MRAAVIFGLGISKHDLEPFQEQTSAEWVIGMPASRSEADVIVVFGGDGTVHRHLTELVKLQLPVLVVPKGSGNDFARALKLASVRDSLAAWKAFSSGAGNVQKIDLGVIRPMLSMLASDGEHSSDMAATRTRYFCCVAGCGLDAEVARMANRLPRWLRGRGGYALALPAALANFSAPQVKLCVAPLATEGSDFAIHTEGPATLVAFANAPAYGHGMRIAPRAALNDRQIDICIVGHVGKLRLLRLFPTVYSGRHLSLPEVQYFRAERVRIETEPPSPIYADGEYVCETPAEIWVAISALQVISFAVLH
jgi:diacylglycerol kinase (ATP)